MKLVRFGDAGAELPGLVDSDGVVRDLSAHLTDIGPAALSPSALAKLRALDPAQLPLAPAGARLGPPVAAIGKILAFGLNYLDHARESNKTPPPEPMLFMKPTSSLNGPNDDVMIPKEGQKTDWEVELGVVIGARARCIGEAEALAHVAGYVLANDVSERAFQHERGGTWDKGKGCDTFCPLGPWLITADEIPDPQSVGLWLDVNGARMQNGNTSDMIFGVAKLISYASHFMTLHPGDVIVTGTPAGVGAGQKPTPRFLQPGDVVTLGGSGLGEQRQRIVAWSEQA